MERQKFCTDGAVGHLYGTTFEVQKGELTKIKTSDLDADVDLEQQSGEDNRSLVDLDSNQKLSRDDILNMKKNMSGVAIVDQLVEHSSTFQKKTEFSQQKYIKKKKKKYVPMFTAVKPTSRLLAQMYYNRGPRKICNLRADALAQILTHANVRAGSKLMVVESCLGLVLGSIMERMAGHGTLIQLYGGQAPVRPALESFNFPNHFYETLNVFPLSQVATLGIEKETPKEPDLLNVTTDPVDNGDVDMNNSRTLPNASAEDSPEVAANDTDEEMDTAADEKSEGQRRKRKAIREQQTLISKKIIEQKDMDGLICATRFHPTPVVLAIVDYLAPSRPLVVFSQYKEPLVDCYVKLRDKGGMVCLKMTETWLREYQVLSNRTHPQVNMSGCGGYLLTGMTVASD